MAVRRRRAACLALLAALALAGCGLGEGKSQGGDGASLRVTRGFGQKQLSQRTVETVRDGDTVMRFLQGSNKVKTRYGGNFVQSIDGLAGTGAGGRHDWFYYVNGLLADKGATEFELNPGDVVQWDYRNWAGAPDVRAIVGAFPEPFLHGQGGKRLPVRVECQDTGGRACRGVKKTLLDAGVPATGSSLGTSGTQKVGRVVVGDWNRVRALPSARAIELGPRRSGVFARYRGDGAKLDLLDASGKVARTLGPSAGLVAALRPADDELLWVVTGGDDAGVARAAGAFRAQVLRNAFAVAVPGPGAVVKLPLGGGS
jgi:uncharacterized protein DUF4430